VIEPRRGSYRRVYEATVAATGDGAQACDEEDVRRNLTGLDRLPQAAVRQALVDLGAGWLGVRPVNRDGSLVLGSEARP
jgi:hypothetical protein